MFKKILGLGCIGKTYPLDGFLSNPPIIHLPNFLFPMELKISYWQLTIYLSLYLCFWTSPEMLKCGYL